LLIGPSFWDNSASESDFAGARRRTKIGSNLL